MSRQRSVSQGVLPASLNAEALQLVVLEKQSAAASTTTSTGAGSNTDTTKQATSLPVAITSLAGAGVAGEATSYAAAQAYKIGDSFKLHQRIVSILIWICRSLSLV